MKTKFKIINKDGEELIVEGVSLLRVMHSAVKKLLDERDSGAKKSSVLNVNNAKQWLNMVGHLYAHPTKHDLKQECWLPIQLKIENSKINIEAESKVVFPEGKHSYEAITQEILAILRKGNHSHAELANAILARLSGNEYQIELEAGSRKFLDSLIVLMFGVEVSRNNDTLLTSLLLLDLIGAQQVYGRRNTPFDWNCAFVSRYGYRWDDYEKNNYGGKYPMSQKSTGTGNLGLGVAEKQGVLEFGRGHVFDKSEIWVSSGAIDSDGEEALDTLVTKYVHDENELEDVFTKYPQRHSVPRREISLIVHWLDSLSEDSKTPLMQAEDEESLLVEIENLFMQRLRAAFLGEAPAQWLTGVDSQKAVSPLPLFFAKDFNGPAVFWKHVKKDNPQSEGNIAEGFFHRIEVPCKLIPGWLIKQETKALRKKVNAPTIRGEGGGFVNQETAKEENKCIYCYSRDPSQPLVDYPPTNSRIVVTMDRKHLHVPSNDDCAVSLAIGFFTHAFEDANVEEKTAAIMFFGDPKTKEMKKCSRCFPEPPAEEMAKMKIASKK